MRVLGVIFVLLSLCASATASPTSKLVENCTIAIRLDESKQWTHADEKLGDATARGMCYGYIESAVWSMAECGEGILTRPWEAKLPEKFNLIQLTKMFLAYVDRHHDELDKEALYTIWTAWTFAYPCKTTGTAPGPAGRSKQ
jgi:Rap1a immunity proteins